MPSLLLDFAEGCYYLCLAALAALPAAALIWFGWLLAHWRHRRRRPAVRTPPECTRHEVDPDRERARRTAVAFRSIAEGSLGDVGRRGVALIERGPRKRARRRARLRVR